MNNSYVTKRIMNKVITSFQHKTILPSIIDIYSANEDLLWPMCRMMKDETGLAYDLWLCNKYETVNSNFSFPIIRIKIENYLIPFIVYKENICILKRTKIFIDINYPQFVSEIEYLQKYIHKYYDVINDHWNGRLSDKQTLNLLGCL